MLVLVAALLFTKGETWSYERTLRFQNDREGIDYGEEERVDAKVLRADKDGYQIQFSRRTTASLVGSDRVPVPTVPAELTVVDLLPSGKTGKISEQGDLWALRILRIELAVPNREAVIPAAWKAEYPVQRSGLDRAVIDWTAAEDPLIFRFTYQEGVPPEVTATGTVRLAPKTRSIESLRLTCPDTTLPTTGLRVILTVDQRRVMAP